MSSKANKTVQPAVKEQPEKQHSKAYTILYEKGVLYFVLAFMLPAAIMLYAFKKNLIHPYGHNQMLVVDLWHQYFPFFKVVREKLLNGGSFLYSWENGMGTNFLSLISYYAASPLNWLSVLFDEEHVRDSLMYILIAKIGFSSAFFSTFLRYTFKRRDLSTVLFGALFALCSYTLGYYWNVMWFDTIALFPLVMTGVTALCREGKWKLYTIALALSLISNYYIGYFTCIFTVFMFAAAAIIECKGIKDFFLKLWLVVRSSVIGIGLGAFILIPAYMGLRLTYSMNNTFPSEISWYESWQDIFANLISYSEPAMKEGLPNFACGMIAIVLIGPFLFSAGIKIREKIAAVLMLALIAVSCNMNVLNYIWHGFHVTNQIPYRFAFIFSFVLLTAAYRAYDVMTAKGIKVYQLILLLIGPAAVFFLNYRKAGESFSFEGAIKSSVIITGAYILIITAGKLFPFTKQNVRTAVMNICIAAAIVSELVSNAALGVKTVGSSDYDSYPTKYTDVQEILGTIRSQDSTPFYRSEFTTTYTLNDSSLYGFYGVSQFSSSAIVEITKMFHRLGLYASEAGNRYYYRISTPLVNDMLGIKYIMSRNGMLRTDEDYLNYSGSAGSTYYYENKYPLSMGFMMNEKVLELSTEEALNPFEYQNDLARCVTGEELDLFLAQPVALVEYDNMDVEKRSYGDYSFTKDNIDNSASVTYQFASVPYGQLYGYCTNGGIDSVNVSCGGDTIDNNVQVIDYPVVFPMGSGGEEGVTTLKLTPPSDKNHGTYKLMVYAMQHDKYMEVYDALADEQLEISKFSDTEIEGRIDVKNDGVMYLSIPYEKGWRVYADGVRTETFPVLGAMTGIKLGAGAHDIKIAYTPEGFNAGLVISGAMLLLFILFVYTDSRKRKKAAKAAAEAPAEVSPEPEKAESSDAETEIPEVENEESESVDSISGNEVSRVPEAEQCADGAGGTGGEGIEGTE